MKIPIYKFIDLTVIQIILKYLLLYGFNMRSNMKVCRNIQDLRFFSKIPDSYWDSKRFVLDSSWCRTPRTSIPQGARPQLTLVSYGSWIEFYKKFLINVWHQINVPSFNMRQLPFLDAQSFVDIFIEKLFK